VAGEYDPFIEALHRSAWQLVAAVTGGGSRAIAELLERPGASRTVLEAVVPYSPRALGEWLGRRPEQACSEATARAMAMASWTRARHLADDASAALRLAGVGATASLASDRPKRGPHRIHVAVQTATTTHAASLELLRGRRARGDEERIAAGLVLAEVARACEVEAPLARSLAESRLEPTERALFKTAVAEPSWRPLLAGAGGWAPLDPSGRPPTQRTPPPRLVLSGAFNPLHAGHLAMMRLAEQRCGCAGAWELSVRNVDKLPLDYLTLRERIAGIVAADGTRAMCVTGAATFREKADCFPGALFVIGADTARRLADPAYYGGSVADRDAAVERLAAQECRFLVFGRRAESRFETLDDLGLPPDLRRLCDGVAEEAFRSDVSSTAVRRAARAAAERPTTDDAAAQAGEGPSA